MTHPIYVIGYPGDVGGANTECWHTVKLWQKMGFTEGVRLIPTWRADPAWRSRLAAIGAETVDQNPSRLEVPAGAICVGFCNSQFIRRAPRLRDQGARLVWVPCMTYLTHGELCYLADGGRMDAWVCQSAYQIGELRGLLEQFGEDRKMIRIPGAFDASEFQFEPRARWVREALVIGHLSRPDAAKFHPQFWQILSCVPNARIRVMGWSKRIEAKIGAPPANAEVLRPGAESVADFLHSLHVLLIANDSARENWPRIVLEAMAAGVAIVAENRGGIPEMLRQESTGYLFDDADQARYFLMKLYYDEQARMGLVIQGHWAVETQLARPAPIAAEWRHLFETIDNGRSVETIRALASLAG